MPYLEYVFTLLGYRVDSLVLEPTTRWTEEERRAFRQDALAIARERGAALR
ncbi:hypothetical protein [Mycobacterium sp. SMC-4]|uniref:hypothetical protein n=1 Tax=Mycobacterium sp. SMC-4 TaxID=2857059 RepID=UPI0021B2D599|nr:hypothetical protein [Mycobacterium sp. SMC-4]